jgi:hypothetical protein
MTWMSIRTLALLPLASRFVRLCEFKAGSLAGQ